MSKRGLTLAEAADLVGISQSTFCAWVRKGLVPGPWPGTRKYDRKALEQALDKLSDIAVTNSHSAYDDWKAKQNADAA